MILKIALGLSLDFPFDPKQSYMKDEKNNINSPIGKSKEFKESAEVTYIMSRFPHKTREQIMRAIKLKGPVRRDIMRYLERKTSK